MAIDELHFVVESIRKLLGKLTPLGVACEVIVPTLVVSKAGDRVNTDRRDAEKLALC